MEISKSKLNIIGLIALVVICTGSFIGVRAMNSSVNTDTTVPSVYQTSAESTTAPIITQAPITVPTTVFDNTTTLNIEAVITTFPISTTEPTTTEPATTEPTTTQAPTVPTTKATTTKKPTTTKKATTTRKVTTTGKSNAAVFDEGLAGYKYDQKGNFYYTSTDPWQRQFGYNEFFDVAAGFVSIYMDTMRCKFEYGNKDWMIQFWKGQYGMLFVGHEIGVYTKPKTRLNEHYDAASNEDALYMELTGYRKNNEIYHRDYGKYWWCTGFVPGTLDKLSDRSELWLECRITMKDYDMLLGFCNALKKNGLVLDKDFSTSGLDVFVTW